MDIPRLGIGVAIAVGLGTLVWQNNAPQLALRFLGNQTVPLPLGVWLSGAIAAGMLTTLLIFGLTQRHSRVSPANRRQWTVRPEGTPPPYNTSAPPGRTPPPSDGMGARAQAQVSSPRGADAAVRSRIPNQQQAVEDWRAWGDRVSPRQWEDWSDAERGNPQGAGFSRGQRRDLQKAETTLQDLDQGWDASAQEVIYVAPGGSVVEDALDEIEEGWDDWDEADSSLGETAYAQRYEGREQATRRDVIYAPPDEEPEETVYDADYRVIVPPYRPLDEGEVTGDRG